jgi:predicted RNA methylase
MSMTATYSPDDNKLRLYPLSRLDTETYNRVKAAGFKWAPRQELFVAPMWTPGRYDLLVELCGEVGDEDQSLAQRAEDRADRFEDYSGKRASEANSARLAVHAIADHIPFGQPILVGHHSERRARKDAERIDNGIRRAVKLWETSEYWKHRAAAALSHAQYKERPDVRHRRIKTIEADRRKQLKEIEQAETFLQGWNAEGLTHERALVLANYSQLYRCFTLAEFPRQPPASQYEGQMGLWSALDGGVITWEQARDLARKTYPRIIARARRWVEHYDFRLSYERAMVEEQGGLVGTAHDIQPGGRVLIGDSWLAVVRVNKDGEGRVCSVTTKGRYANVRGIEEVKGYEAPTEEAAAAMKAAKKLPPLVNVPGEGFLEMTAAEWKKKHPDYKAVRVCSGTAEHGIYRYRTAVVPGGSWKRAQVYITDAKRVDIPAPKADDAPAVSLAPVPDMAALQERAERLQQPKQPDPAAAPFDALRETLKNGGVQVVSAPQLFVTPPELAERVAELADIRLGERVLEPSAGTGNLLRAINAGPGRNAIVTAIEINHELCKVLRQSVPDATVIQADFLECNNLGSFDKVVMNPPFANAADIEHVRHAFSMVRPGGLLVAICANGPRQQAAFAALIEEHGGSYDALPPGSFASSGTNVNAALLTLTA